MDNDSERELVEARISGTSSRALAKTYGMAISEVEETIERHLGTLDCKARMRAVKLSVARLEAILATFFQKAVAGDVQAGTLVVKILERLSFILGLDVPITQRLDVYQVAQTQGPSDHEQIKRAILGMARGNPDYQPSGNGNGSEPSDQAD